MYRNRRRTSFTARIKNDCGAAVYTEFESELRPDAGVTPGVNGAAEIGIHVFAPGGATCIDACDVSGVQRIAWGASDGPMLCGGIRVGRNVWRAFDGAFRYLRVADVRANRELLVISRLRDGRPTGDQLLVRNFQPGDLGLEWIDALTVDGAKECDGQSGAHALPDNDASFSAPPPHAMVAVRAAA